MANERLGDKLIHRSTRERFEFRRNRPNNRVEVWNPRLRVALTFDRSELRRTCGRKGGVAATQICEQTGTGTSG